MFGQSWGVQDTSGPLWWYLLELISPGIRIMWWSLSFADDGVDLNPIFGDWLMVRGKCSRL